MTQPNQPYPNNYGNNPYGNPPGNVYGNVPYGADPGMYQPMPGGPYNQGPQGPQVPKQSNNTALKIILGVVIVAVVAALVVLGLYMGGVIGGKSEGNAQSSAQTQNAQPKDPQKGDVNSEDGGTADERNDRRKYEKSDTDDYLKTDRDRGTSGGRSSSLEEATKQLCSKSVNSEGTRAGLESYSCSVDGLYVTIKLNVNDKFEQNYDFSKRQDMVQEFADEYKDELEKLYSRPDFILFVECYNGSHMLNNAIAQ